MSQGLHRVPRPASETRSKIPPAGVFSRLRRNQAGALVEAQFSMRGAAKNLEARDEATALRRVCDLTDQAQWTFFELGCLLTQIQANRWFGGYPSFRALVEGEFAVSYRQALNLIAIRNTMVALKVNPSRLLHLGWTKLRTICPVLTTDNVDEWVERATTHTRGDLETLVARTKGDGERPTVSGPEGTQHRTSPRRRVITSDTKVPLARNPRNASRAPQTDPQQVHPQAALVAALRELSVSDMALVLGEALVPKERNVAIEILSRAAEACGLSARFDTAPASDPSHEK